MRIAFFFWSTPPSLIVNLITLNNLHVGRILIDHSRLMYNLSIVVYSLLLNIWTFTRAKVEYAPKTTDLIMQHIVIDHKGISFQIHFKDNFVDYNFYRGSTSLVSRWNTHLFSFWSTQLNFAVHCATRACGISTHRAVWWCAATCSGLCIFFTSCNQSGCKAYLPLRWFLVWIDSGDESGGYPHRY